MYKLDYILSINIKMNLEIILKNYYIQKIFISNFLQFMYKM